MEAQRQPGDNEAAAAIEATLELYGEPRHEHGVGDLIWYRPGPAHAPRAARVVGYEIGDEAIVRDELTGELANVLPHQLARV